MFICLSKTVWASFGDSSTSCKETISIASHCFYSWFLANGLSHCNINCTELRASLPITRSQNNNTHHNLHFLLFWWQSVHEEKEHSDLCSAIVSPPPPPPHLLRDWRRSGPAAPNGILPVVSLEPWFHKVYLNWSRIQWTDIPAQILIPAENASDWPTERVFVNRLFQSLQVKEATSFSPGNNSSQY